MNKRDLHKALKSEVVDRGNAAGVEFAVAKLQWGKNDAALSLHAAPRSHTMSGIQTTDFLSHLGFHRGTCSFLPHQECYARWIDENLDFQGFLEAFDESFKRITDAQRHLEDCGFFFPQDEGWGYFYNKPARGRKFDWSSGDGHTSSIPPQRMKEAKDEVFYYVFTWIDNDGDKGWTIHYRPNQTAYLSSEIESAFEFLGIRSFEECPQFDFEPCHWKFIQFRSRGDSAFDSNADAAHRWFDAHPEHFSPGLEALLSAHSLMEKVGMQLLPFRDLHSRLEQDIRKRTVTPEKPAKAESKFEFDVAISFAGTERQHAETLASLVREAGFRVFYDHFYPEDLWGKDLVVSFNEIYSKRARYCVIFVSEEYNNREWTIHERRSTQERMLKERGREYILPIKVDTVELPGMPSTIGYVPLSLGTEKIADLLIKKLNK